VDRLVTNDNATANAAGRSRRSGVSGGSWPTITPGQGTPFADLAGGVGEETTQRIGAGPLARALQCDEQRPPCLAGPGLRQDEALPRAQDRDGPRVLAGEGEGAAEVDLAKDRRCSGTSAASSSRIAAGDRAGIRLQTFSQPFDRLRLTAPEALYNRWGFREPRCHGATRPARPGGLTKSQAATPIAASPATGNAHRAAASIWSTTARDPPPAAEAGAIDPAGAGFAAVRSIVAAWRRISSSHAAHCVA